MRFLFSGILALLASGSSSAQTTPNPESRTEPRLQATIQRALAENPGIEEMERRIQAARARVAQAGALPDPMLSVGAVNVPLPDLSFRRDDMTMKMASLEQELPARGKRGTARRVAEAEVAVTDTMYAEYVNRLVAEVADSYFELASLDARLAIARRTLERLKRVSDSVRTRYRVGEGSLADVLLAGVEESKRADRLRSLEAERAAVAARFNTLQNLPPSAPVSPVPLPPFDPLRSDRDALARELEESPVIRQAFAEVRRGEEALELARLGRRPDLKLMASYGQRDGFDDMVGATVGFNLPFFQRKRVAAQIAEKEAELSAAKSRLASVRLELSRRVEESLIAIASETERAALYRSTILTQDATAARAAEEAYSVGKIDFQTYVGAVKALDDDEAETIERETAVPRARARLQAATGVPFYKYRIGQEVPHD